MPAAVVVRSVWELLAQAPRPGLLELEQLDGVDWASLRHAYRRADDVPEMIRALAAAPTVKQATKAENRLWGSILHQGMVCDATAPALPFVLGILVDHEPARLPLLAWLTDVSWTLNDEPTWGDSPDVRACRVVLVRAAPSLVHLLELDDAEARCEVATFLGRCVDAADVLWSALRARWTAEPEPVVQADLLVSLAHLASAAHRVTETLALTESWWASGDDRLRCAAAHARLEMDPDDAPALAVLVDALPKGYGMDTFWGTGEPSTIVELLARSRSGFTDSRVRQLVFDAVARGGSSIAEGMLREVMRRTFPGGAADVPARADELDAVQRDVVVFLASGRVAFEEGNLILSTRSLLYDYRLPPNADQLRTWLAG